MIYMFKVIHYYVQMHLKVFATSALKCELDATNFLSAQELVWQTRLKKTSRIKIIN